METATLERPHARPMASNVTVKLNELDRMRIATLARHKQRTAHYIMKEAIERYLQTEEAELAMLKIVDDSVDHYDATGLHISLEEFKGWVDAVKTNPTAELPACHG
jgi:predicted transcriptional regulator